MKNTQQIPPPKLVLIITTITSFMTAFMGSALNVALPTIGKEFNASALTVSWFSTIYLLTTAAVIIPVGKLADIFGRIKFFKSGILLFAAGSLFCALAQNKEILLIFRGLQGIGSAMIFSCATAILVSAYPQNKRGKALGITVAAVYTGLSSGPFLGGIITDYFGWEFIFFGTSFLGIIISLLTMRYFRVEWQEFSKSKFDLTGTIILTAAILLVMIGISILPDLSGLFIAAAGILFSIGFYYYEQKLDNPLFNISLLKENRAFTFSNLAALINYSATFAIAFLLSFYLQIVKGLTPKETGFILITQPIIQAVFSPIAGRFSDRIEPRLVSSSGMGLITIGLIVFIFLRDSMSYFIIIGNLAWLGFGFALFSSPNANAIMSSVEKKHYGIASSTMAFMRLLGQMFSMGIVIIIFNLIIGGQKITSEYKHEFIRSAEIAFILFSLLCFIGIFASLARGKIHNQMQSH